MGPIFSDNEQVRHMNMSFIFPTSPREIVHYYAVRNLLFLKFYLHSTSFHPLRRAFDLQIMLRGWPPPTPTGGLGLVLVVVVAAR